MVTVNHQQDTVINGLSSSKRYCLNLTKVWRR